MKKKNKFPIFPFLLSIALLALGFYFELIANKERIFKKSINNIFENIIEVVNMFEFDTGLSNNYRKEADIKITSNQAAQTDGLIDMQFRRYFCLKVLVLSDASSATITNCGAFSNPQSLAKKKL